MIDPNGTFDWNHIRAFLTTAEEGSLSAAARKLNLTQPTLGRQVAALEEDLGIMLFERVGRSLELTVAGGELLEHVRAMREAADRVALVASGQNQDVEGRVAITASDVYSVHLLPPILKDLRAKAPKLVIEVVASDDVQDLMRREADIAIRHVRPEQPDLIARLVREAKGYFYASQEYLDLRGRPQTVDDLAKHDFVGSGDVPRMLEYLKPMGFPIDIDNFRTGSDSGLVAWELCRQGFGIAPMADDVAEATPGIERVLPELAPIVFPIWLTTHRELHTSRRIRLVFDALAEHLTET
ncbi:LysR family transcriptional regulator [Shimia sp. MIT1388]|uniref:LysR family transcriptional regulator n=1 Tax=Shimia sp. MIT1388 TaxID=3096992 RepID=UPI00399A6B1A